MSVVRWALPACPLVHAAGDHATEAAVFGRDEMFAVVAENVAGFPAACPRSCSGV
jgi:hypothetical protein